MTLSVTLWLRINGMIILKFVIDLVNMVSDSSSQCRTSFVCQIGSEFHCRWHCHLMSNGNVNTNGIPVIETQTLEWSSAGLGNAVSPLTSSQISVSVIWNSAVTDSANTREAHQKLHSSSSIHIDNNDSDIDNIIHPVQIPNGHGTINDMLSMVSSNPQPKSAGLGWCVSCWHH